jgi:hypothetical protein
MEATPSDRIIPASQREGFTDLPPPRRAGCQVQDLDAPPRPTLVLPGSGRSLTGLRWLIAGLIVLVLLVLCLPAFQTIHWVGATDLTVEFALTDADTGEAVPGAALRVHTEGGFYRGGWGGDGDDLKDFELVTGPDGAARCLCPDSMCFGTKSLFTDTFGVHLPWWWIRASAPGYQPSALTEVDVPEHWRAVRRTGPGTAKVVIPVRLKRTPGWAARR